MVGKPHVAACRASTRAVVARFEAPSAGIVAVHCEWLRRMFGGGGGGGGGRSASASLRYSQVHPHVAPAAHGMYTALGKADGGKHQSLAWLSRRGRVAATEAR